MSEKILLPDFEIEILNKAIPTRSFADITELKPRLIKLVDDRKDDLIASREITEKDFGLHRTEVVNSMIQFLVRNQFYGVREGGVYFMTEKGKYLQKQGSLEKYVDWQEGREGKLLKDMHTIEERGFLDEDQTFKKEHTAVKNAAKEPVDSITDEANRKNFGMYVVIIVVLIILAAIGKSHKWW